MMPSLASALSGLLLSLAFPPFNFHFLAWFALIPIFIFKNSGFREGFLMGFISSLIIYFWLWKTFYAAQIAFPVTLGCWLGLSAVLAMYPASQFWLLKKCPEGWFRPLIAGFLWILSEKLRGVLITGFPWALLAHTQVHNLEIIQMASVVGELGVSFLLVLFNASAAMTLKSRARKDIFFFSFTVLVVFALFLSGRHRIQNNTNEAPSSSKIKVAVIQGNIDQYQKWDSAYENLIKTRYAILVTEALQRQPDLIIWPESSLPGWYPNDTQVKSWLTEVIKNSRVHHLVGAVTSRQGKEYNSAFLIDPNGNVVAEYSKQHLVPFGEYIPFGGFLKRWVPYLGQLGTFSAGENPVLFEMKGIRLAPNICYEAMFSRLVFQSVQRGADVIVNLTNDGWFLDTAAPEQHFNANIFRAVENGRPVIRAANTGISAMINETGTVISQTQLLTTAVLYGEVAVPQKKTIFTLLYSWLCLAN